MTNRDSDSSEFELTCSMIRLESENARIGTSLARGSDFVTAEALDNVVVTIF